MTDGQSAGERPGTRTIGIAIPVPEPHAGELQRWRKELRDPVADSVPTHITLLPPTEVAGAQLTAIEEHLRIAAAAVEAFDIELGAADTFRPVSPVVFVRLMRGADGCADLEHRVRSGPLARELAFAYHPHVTVAHDVAEEDLDRGMRELASYSARFRVDSFCLYEHGADGVWRPKRQFCLGAGSDGDTPL